MRILLTSAGLETEEIDARNFLQKDLNMQYIKYKEIFFNTNGKLH